MSGPPTKLITLVSFLAAACSLLAGAAARPGVEPDTPWSCPDSHPIKGYVSAESGARVYHVPGGPFYEEASPERCYASDAEARRDGSRPAADPRAPSPVLPVVAGGDSA